MTATGVDAQRARRYWWRPITGFAGVVALTLAGILSVTYVDTADSSCGTVLHDTRTSGICADVMPQRIAAVLILGVVGTAGVAIWWLARTKGRNRRAHLPTVLLALAAAVACVVAARTLADPGSSAEGRSCGSLLNPVKYEGMTPEQPPGCGGYMSDQRSRVVVAAVGGVLFVAAALAAGRFDTWRAAPTEG